MGLKLDLSKQALAQMMDYSSLNPHVNKQEILEGCAVSKEYNFKGFHVNPTWAPLVADELEGTGIETGWLVSFPFGTNDTKTKVAEAVHGAKVMRDRPWVIDMVTNIGALRGKDYDLYKTDMAEVAKAAHDGGAQCKAILEVAYLNDDELKIACELATEAGMDWVKTSTGCAGGPSLKQVHIMRQTVPAHMQVKVAGTGSFWTPTVVLGCLLAGATRIGTRSAPWIVDELSGLTKELLEKVID